MIPDHSLRRRITQLERQLAELSRELRTTRQAMPSHRAPRETWLGRVATSPTPGSDDNVYSVELLSCTFPAIAGEQEITEHERGSTVLAATWPARSLSAGQDVMVHRIRGALAGDSDEGEWWIPGDAASVASNPMAIFTSHRISSRDGRDYVTTGDPGSVFFQSLSEYGDARITPLGTGVSGSGSYEDGIFTFDSGGRYRVTVSAAFALQSTGGAGYWSQYTDGASPATTPDHVHLVRTPRPLWISPQLEGILSGSGLKFRATSEPRFFDHLASIDGDTALPCNGSWVVETNGGESWGMLLTALCPVYSCRLSAYGEDVVGQLVVEWLGDEDAVEQTA